MVQHLHQQIALTSYTNSAMRKKIGLRKIGLTLMMKIAFDILHSHNIVDLAKNIAARHSSNLAYDPSLLPIGN